MTSERKTCRRWIAAAAICLSVFTSALSAPATALSNPPTTLPVRCSVLLDPGVDVRAVEISPDGQTAYVAAHETAVRLWPEFVHFWPEWSGALVLILCLVLLWRVRKVARLPQDPGEPHCRQCNYQLTGCPSNRCPECGHTIDGRGRVIGRPTVHRVAPILATMGVLIAAYAVVRWSGLPRDGSLSKRYDWFSTSAFRWAERTKTEWLSLQGVEVFRLMEVDVRRGKIRERWDMEPCAEWRPDLMTLSSDGNSLFIGRNEPPHIQRWDTRSRRLVQSYRSSGVCFGMHSMAMADDDRMLYVLAPSYGNRQWSYSLLRWDIASGAERAAILLPDDPQLSSSWDRVHPIRGTGQLLVIGYQRAIIVDCVGSGLRRELPPRKGGGFSQLPLVLGPGGIIYLSTNALDAANGSFKGLRIERWNLESGLPLSDLPIPTAGTGTFSSPPQILLTRDGRTLFTISRPWNGPWTVDAWNVADANHLAELAAPGLNYAAGFRLSADDKTLLLWGRQASPRNDAPYRLVFYDVGQIQPGAPATTREK